MVAEVIVVDSESEDETVEIIERELTHPKVRVFSGSRGLYAAIKVPSS